MVVLAILSLAVWKLSFDIKVHVVTGQEKCKDSNSETPAYSECSSD